MSPKKKPKQTHSETSNENVLFCCYIKIVVVKFRPLSVSICKVILRHSRFTRWELSIEQLNKLSHPNYLIVHL